MPKIAKVKTTKIYKKLVSTFVVIVLIILGLIVYYSFSKTVISLTLTPQAVSTHFIADIKNELTDEDISKNTLKGYLFTTEVAGSKTFTNTNEGAVVDDIATGTVAIYNNWSQDQPLAATTRLLTPDNILFRIKDRVDVPAGGKLENVAVYADQPGASGNIGPTTFTIPGLWEGLQEKIYAESTTAMTGGVKSAKVITSEQINKASQELKKELLDKAKVDINKQDAIQNLPANKLGQAFATITLDSESSVEVGQQAATFDLTQSVQIMSVSFDEAALLSSAIKRLKAELPDSEELHQYSSQNITYSIEEYNLDDQTAKLKVALDAFSVPKLTSPIFDRAKILNKDEQEIKAYYSSYDEIGSVTIQFSPFWVTKAPSLKNKIEINIKE